LLSSSVRSATAISNTTIRVLTAGIEAITAPKIPLYTTEGLFRLSGRSHRARGREFGLRRDSRSNELPSIKWEYTKELKKQKKVFFT